MNKSSENMNRRQNIQELLLRLLLPTLIIVTGVYFTPYFERKDKAKHKIETESLKVALSHSVQLLFIGKDSVEIDSLKKIILHK